jgi:hypothetical protein
MLVAALPVFGQTYGEITGTVTDPSGAIIGAAAVTVTNVATNQVRTVQTNEAGNYTVPFLVPGTYTVKSESTGFKTATRTNLVLQVGDVARIDFQMEVGEVAESIEVSAASALLQTESTAVGTVIDNQRIVELPINGRNFLNLVRLSPNVSAEQGAGGQANDRQGGERANQPISIAGQRMQYNRYTLDGVENTDVNFNTFVIRPSIDALQEFKVQTGVYSAEYGRATAQVNATTKSGTNELHGTAFYFLRNSALDAAEWNVTGRKNPFRRNQYGFTVGGKLIPDRLFFLSNFEAYKDRLTREGRARVAPARMRGGDFGGQGRKIYDPLTRTFDTNAQGQLKALSAQQFANNVVPQNRIHPSATDLLEFYPEATRAGDDTSTPNYVRDLTIPTSWEQFTQRIDFTENSNSAWFGRFSWGDEYVGGGQTFPAQVGKTATKVYQVVLSNTRTLSPTVVNEFRAGYNQLQNDQLLHFAYDRDVSAELGIPGLNSPVEAAWGTPSIGLGQGIDGFGESSEGPYVNRNHTFQLLDNISMVRGNHTFKFGGEARRDRFNQIGNQFPRGSFGFENLATADPVNVGATGHAYASFLIGESRRSERALGIANVMFRATSVYWYAEDTWKITPKLTMNLGVRYERTPAWDDKYRGVMNVQMFDPGVGDYGILPGTKVPIFTRPGEGDFHEGLGYHFHDAIPTQVGDQFLGEKLVGDDNNDFAPRIGLAYSPTDRWTFRAGFGVFYTQDTGNPVFDMGRNLGGRGRFESDTEKPNSNLSDPWAFERAAFQCSNWSGVCLGPPYTLGNIHDRVTPYIHQWILNVQRQLTDSLLLEVGYQGNSGHKLQRLRAYNEAVLKSDANDRRTIAQRTPWPAYGRIQQVDNSVNSNYHALSAKLQQRFARGITYLVGYTWSKAIDNGSAIRTNTGDRLFPTNSYDLHRERALSQFHNGQRFVASVLYDIPFRAENAALNAILGGWQIGSILTFSEGTPTNVGNIGDRANMGDLNYPDATGISPFVDSPTPQKFWDVAAFDPRNAQLTFRNGNVGRNILTTPGLAQWDFSLSKDIRIREGHSLEFRFESFNFSNHPNWNTPSADSQSASFGVITSARTMRQNQFALKYSF